MRFSDLTHTLKDATIFLDIDGTLVSDAGKVLSESVLQKIQELADHNDVYLSSNGHEQRTQELAKQLGVRHLPRLRKPLKHAALASIERRERVVVIGDKFLTDGLFALSIGAEFIKVAHVREGKERARIRLSYTLDALAWSVAPLIALMRPHQWLKNLLVFAPAFFASAVFAPGVFTACVAAFIAFSAAASGVYVLNDVFDREQDRLHPKKRHRPIAAGLVSPAGAYATIALLFAVVLVFGFKYPMLAPVLALYILLNGAYSAWFKHVAIVDIVCVSCFYILRIEAGGLATNIPISSWLILCVFFLSLFLIIGKRLAEYQHDKRRKVLEEYSKEALNYMLAGSAALTIIAYGTYTIIGHDTPLLVYSTAFIVLALFRTMNRLYTHPHHAEAPEKLIFKDPWLFAIVMMWGIYMFGIFYAGVV